MRSVERIEQDIAALNKKVAAFSEELQGTYANYLKVLSEAVERQFILAVYHVCTQGYPAEFLGLSLSARQELQQNLRSLAKQIPETLPELLRKPGSEQATDSYTLPHDPLVLIKQWLTPPNVLPPGDASTPKPTFQSPTPDIDPSLATELSSNPDQPSSIHQVASGLPTPDIQQNPDTDDADRPLNAAQFSDSAQPPSSEQVSNSGNSFHGVVFHPDPNSYKIIAEPNTSSRQFSSSPLVNQNPSSNSAPSDLNPVDSTATQPPDPQPSPAQIPEKSSAPLTPDLLMQWQITLEQEILAELRALSHHANRLLQQAGILPKKLPEPLLQSASQSQMAEMVSHYPNLLNLLLATAGDDQSDEDNGEDESPSLPPSLIKIIAIHLRLTEIEFASSQATSMRHKLRNLSAQLKQLKKIYRSKQKELAIAEAEAAWHSTWFEK
jgi:hypothetical protein